MVNISNVTLPAAEEDLLSKGLLFCPKPSAADRFQLEEDLHQFFRRLRLEEFFFEEDSEDMEYSPFKNKSKWTPAPNRDLALETLEKYIRAVKKDLLKSLDSCILFLCQTSTAVLFQFIYAQTNSEAAYFF